MPKTATRNKTAPAAVGDLRTLQLPVIGARWPETDDVFAGLLTDPKKCDYALVVPLDAASDIDEARWANAVAKANAYKKGYQAADRHELALGFATVPHLFKKVWYWSSSQDADVASYAWIQSFDFGTQHYDHKDDDYRARAVRRIYL